MKKKTFIKLLLAAFALLSVSAFAGIADIQEGNGWYYLYNEKGSRYKTMSASTVGELAGYCDTYFVGKNGNWYYFFDDKGNRFMTKSVSEIGKIKHVSNSGFTSINGSWQYSWDKKGNRTGTKPAK